jgi:pimeloyl-ACP methyl ester carboxylesterase
MLWCMPAALTPAGLLIEYETFGDACDPPMLLIMGFGAQLVAWPRGFCQRLSNSGRFVIAFDNRDCGLSSKLDGQGAEIAAIVAAASSGDFVEARRLSPYTMADMAEDGLSVLTALGIERSHVVGSSMGGIIAQTMAIEHPERVLTLTSMMSTSGEPGYGESTPEATAALLTPAPSDRDGYIDAIRSSRIWRSRRYPEMVAARRVAAESYDRCYYPSGVSRHLAAMIAGGSRADALRRLAVPTLVIHGLDDTLVAPSGGERTAVLIPGAQLLLLEDMGHDRPEPLWPRICDAILEHTK